MQCIPIRKYIVAHTHRNRPLCITEPIVIRLKFTDLRPIRRQTVYRLVQDQLENGNTIRRNSILLQIRSRFTYVNRGTKLCTKKVALKTKAVFSLRTPAQQFSSERSAKNSLLLKKIEEEGRPLNAYRSRNDQLRMLFRNILMNYFLVLKTLIAS